MCGVMVFCCGSHTKLKFPTPQSMLTLLENGGRLEQPGDMPDNLWRVVTGLCWAYNPEERANFSQFEKELTRQILAAQENNSCRVCFANPSTYAVVTCNHLCVCEACARLLQVRRKIFMMLNFDHIFY